MRKGMVEAVGFIFMMGLTIIISLMLFFLVTYDQSPDSVTIERTIDYRVGEIEARSTVQTAMEGEMWRGVDGVGRGDPYNKLSAYKVISYWFSTPEGDKVYINNESVDYQEARQHIIDYLQNTLDGIFVEQRASPRYYNFSILYNGNKYSNKLIFVTPESDSVDADEDALMTTFRYPMAIRGSEKATVSISVEDN